MEIPDRYHTRAATDRLEVLLDLIGHPDMQDWDIELGDADRVSDCCSAYERETLDEDEKFALMTLIVASYDAYLQTYGHSTGLWERMARLLQKDWDLHVSTARYWCCFMEAEEGEEEYQRFDEDPEHQFLVTPLIRSVWCACRGGTA